MNKKTREMVLAAILTALSILITYSPVKLVLPFFTLTLGAHVPTLLALFISPWVVAMTVIGSCIGFFMTIPAPNSIIVVTRAATHIIFALVGTKMIKDGKLNPFIIILVTAILHSVAEGIAVYVLTPIILPGEVALTAACIALAGTFVHHLLDCAITAPILIALSKAKIVHIPANFKIRRKANA
ncbi:MAG: ECF transporter S component [Clostridia bacterium]|nr:ECF transporter S component [Clostridia bacterium]